MLQVLIGAKALLMTLAQHSEKLKEVLELLKELHTWLLPHSQVSQQISIQVPELPQRLTSHTDLQSVRASLLPLKSCTNFPCGQS